MLMQASRESVPIEVSLELTHHCNYRCEHCYIPNFQAPDRMPTARVMTLLEELADTGTLYLTLTGGEIFLRRDWYEIAQRARELGFSLRLFSNGFLIDDAIADRVQTLYCTMEISLYSVRAETFEAVTRRAGSFNKTIAGIEKVRARGIETILKMPLMTHNYDQVGEVSAYAARIGAGFMSFGKIVPRKDGDLTPLRVRVPERDLETYYGGPYSGCSQPPQTSGEVADGPLCAAGSRFASISSAGEVQACNILPGSGGSVLEKPFGEIWRESKWLNFVRNIRREDLHTCGTCSKLSYCGRCHAQAMIEDGDILGPSSWAKEHAEAVERIAARSGVAKTSVVSSVASSVASSDPDS